MTYCLALRLDEGLVFLADTRTNAGIDNISTYRKLHVLRPAPDRVFVLESAGSLATTQEVLDRIQRDLDTPGEHESLATVERLFEAALYIGRLGHEVSQSHRGALAAVGRRRHRHVHPGRPDRRRAARHPPRLPGGQLHPGVRRPAVPADRGEQVRQVHARGGGHRRTSTWATPSRSPSGR